jgi:peptide/nickel transport system substrate-binding protein
MRVGGFNMNSLAKSNSSFTYRSLVVTITLALLVAFGFTNTRAAEEEPLVLGIGTTQDLDSMNPFNTALVVGYEVFSLNYDLLTSFGSNLEPTPGFAESYSVSSDGLTYTFKISSDLLWSDGTPATSADVLYTFKLLLDNEYVGLGYLDSYLDGVTAVTAPDAQTFVLTMDAPVTRILQALVPVLPKHIWEKLTIEEISGTFGNEPPVVGTGPYQAVEWKTGEFVRFVKNPHWRGGELAADEIVLRFFKSADALYQALVASEIDYAHNVSPEQLKQLDGSSEVIEVAVGSANGFTELGFNTYAQEIAGGGASTKALRDQRFRDALGYAIDRETLIEKVLGGYGVPGSTQVPPISVDFHVEPTNPRTFDLELAAEKLEAAGYVDSDGDGVREDLEGKPLNLRLYVPSSDDSYAKAAEFIAGWFGEIGVPVNAQAFDSDSLVDIMLPPEADGKADYDLFIWGWAGDVDPNLLMKIFLTSEIGASSDSFFSNAEYDALYEQQLKLPNGPERKEIVARLQQLMYEQAPYHVLYYDATLVAYRTDKFTGWKNQPADGTPFFGLGPVGYTLLKPASGGGGDVAGENSLLIPLVALLAAAGVFLALRSRRGKRRTDEE